MLFYIMKPQGILLTRRLNVFLIMLWCLLCDDVISDVNINAGYSGIADNRGKCMKQVRYFAYYFCVVNIVVDLK